MEEKKKKVLLNVLLFQVDLPICVRVAVRKKWTAIATKKSWRNYMKSELRWGYGRTCTIWIIRGLFCHPNLFCSKITNSPPPPPSLSLSVGLWIKTPLLKRNKRTKKRKTKKQTTSWTIEWVPCMMMSLAAGGGEPLTVADCINHNPDHVPGVNVAAAVIAAAPPAPPQFLIGWGNSRQNNNKQQSTPPAGGGLIGGGGGRQQNHPPLQQLFQQPQGPLVRSVDLPSLNFVEISFLKVPSFYIYNAYDTHELI